MEHKLRSTILLGTAMALLAACSTPQKMSDGQLHSLGVQVGAKHWTATSALAREGYACFVSGAKREQFDCTKTTGAFPTCVLRVRFSVDDDNAVTTVSASEPACIGTP
jgi:4-hydroxyphenylpyruvate dioxygenase-like putative hemolysin